MRVCTKSYHNFLCHFWLLSLGGLLFAEGDQRSTGSGVRGGGRGLKGVEGGETAIRM